MNVKQEGKELKCKGFRLYNYIPMTSWGSQNFEEKEGCCLGIRYGLGDSFSLEVALVILNDSKALYLFSSASYRILGLSENCKIYSYTSASLCMPIKMYFDTSFNSNVPAGRRKSSFSPTDSPFICCLMQTNIHIHHVHMHIHM